MQGEANVWTRKLYVTDSNRVGGMAFGNMHVKV